MSPFPRHLEDLAERLPALDRDDRILTIGQIDGFVTGIALSPSMPDPEDWLDALLGADEDDDARLAPNEKQLIAALILDHYEWVWDELAEGTFHPAFDQLDGRAVWQSWILGIAASLVLDMEGWQEVEDETVREPLEILLGMAAKASEQATSGTGLEPGDDATIIDSIPLLVQDLYDNLYAGASDAWLDGHADALPASGEQVPLRLGPKVGRNDPCPCGSGKKYKKCCGA